MDIAMTDQELIRRVAVEVMGFEIDPDQPWYGNQLFVRRMGEKTYWGFNPLTNANHWIMVVEKLRQKEYIGSIHILEKFYSVKFGKTYSWDHKDEPAAHNNPGYAICLASLKAIGDDNDK